MKLKVVKIISVISFLMICSLDKDDLPVFIYMLLALYQFITDIISLSFSQHEILWEGITVIPIIGTLYIFLKCKKFTDRYIILFCFIALLSILISFIIPGVYYENSTPKLRLSFIIPFTGFIIASIFSIVLVFRNKNE